MEIKKNMIEDDSKSCPYCNAEPKNLIKEWSYGNINVKRYQCNCGKFYNTYTGPNSFWTIPKKYRVFKHNKQQKKSNNV